MYQIIPTRILALAAACVAITAFLLLDLVPSLAVFTRARYAALFIEIALFIFTLKPVWRLLWKAVPALNRYFPDLNGEYDVELHHNWPIQQRMLEAAAGEGERFDPRSPQTTKPALGITRIRASIDLSFYWIRLKMWSVSPEEAGSVIEDSRTLSTSLIRPCDGHPHRIAYIYQQKNRRDRKAVTDDTVFEGAALINVEGGGETLRGEYWTNRAWQDGLSTAGQIVLTKRNAI
jgi:hypothetical protein